MTARAKPTQSPAETMLAALRSILISGALIERGPLWKIVDHAIAEGETVAAPPIAPAVAAKWLAERNVTPADVRADHRLAAHLVVAVMANGHDTGRTPSLRDFPAIRDELAALTQESML